MRRAVAMKMEFANGLGSEQGFHLHISRLPSQDAFVLLPWDQHLADILQQQDCVFFVTKAVQMSPFCSSLGIHEGLSFTHQSVAVGVQCQVKIAQNWRTWASNPNVVLVNILLGSLFIFPKFGLQACQSFTSLD